MKKLNAIHFSAAKELTKDEQKNLKGGVDALIYACTCRCEESVGEWVSYTSDGKCPYEDANVITFVGYDKCASGMAKCY